MGKGNNTTTTQSGPNPAAANAYYDLLNRSAGVAQTPYQAYGGNLTAPINAQQTTGIANINQGAGFASPYIQEAAGFARGAAQPLTAAEIQQYQSPYTQHVVDATSNWFNNQNQQQQQNVIGNAAAAGALGGDRVGVAQANLASQQTASQAPIIAGLYNQGYSQALGVAQQQQQNRANAAYSIGNLGVSGQNAALTGANAQVGAGNLEQQNEQRRLNALYQQYQIGQAFPYQQTQWLAGVQTGVGSQLGGQSSTTQPAPNPWAQVAGVGLTAASMFLNRGGRIKGFAPGGTVDDSPFAGVGWIPTRGITMGRGAPPPPGVAPQQTAQFKPMDFKGKFGGGEGVGAPLDITSEGGGFSPSGVGSFFPMGSSPAMGGLGPIYRDGGGVHGYALGGSPELDYGDMLPPMARAPLSRGVAADVSTDFAGRWSPVPEAVGSGTFDPQGANAGNFDITPTPVRTERILPTVSDAGLIPMPRERPAEAPQTVAGFGPREDVPWPTAQAAGAQADDTGADEALSFAPTSGVAAPSAVAAPSTDTARRGFGLGLIPDNLRMPMMTAGLAMLASRSPNLGNAIGEGGLAGVGAYTQQKQAELQHAEKRESLGIQTRHIDNETKRLDNAAEHARKTLAETTRHHGAVEGLTKEQRDMQSMQPITIGTKPDGTEVKAIRDPVTKELRVIDPATGKLMPPGEGLPGAKTSGTYIDPATGKPIPQGTEASADGVIPKNAQLVSSSVPYDYSTDAPYIEKGMDVPKPGPVAGKSPRAVETDSEYYLQTGKLPPVARGKSPVAIQQNNYRNAVQNYSGALAQSRGLSPEQTAEMWRTAPGMLRFILGADGRSTVALGTAVRHLDTVQELAKAWAANDTQGINRLRAIISRQFGSEAATNLEAAGQIVGPEIIKALGVAGAGTEHDRQTAAAQFSTARSPAQLKGAVDTVQKLLGGQLEGRKKQALNAGVSEERFKSLIGDRPYEILSGTEKGGAPPPVASADKQALDWANANPSDPRAAAIKKRLGAP